MSVKEDEGSQVATGVLGGDQASVLNILGSGADMPLGVETGAGTDPEQQDATDADIDLLSDSQGGVGAQPGQQSKLGKSAAEQEEGAVKVVPSGDDSSQADSMDTNELVMVLKEWVDEEENRKPPSTEEMAAILEVSPEQSAARRSKQRVGEVDEEVGVAAEHCKAFRNKGMSSEHTLASPDNDSLVISNLNAIGISLGDDGASICVSMDNIREKALGSMQEKEERELLEGEELEKLFL
jgi:hypothetical protein